MAISSTSSASRAWNGYCADHRVEIHGWVGFTGRPSVSSDVLEQIPPLRSNISETVLRIPLGIRAGPAYQLGDGLIVEIESVSNAFA
jgi:hypothetical protein